MLGSVLWNLGDPLPIFHCMQWGLPCLQVPSLLWGVVWWIQSHRSLPIHFRMHFGCCLCLAWSSSLPAFLLCLLLQLSMPLLPSLFWMTHGWQQLPCHFECFLVYVYVWLFGNLQLPSWSNLLIISSCPTVSWSQCIALAELCWWLWLSVKFIWLWQCPTSAILEYYFGWMP